MIKFILKRLFGLKTLENFLANNESIFALIHYREGVEICNIIKNSQQKKTTSNSKTNAHAVLAKT